MSILEACRAGDLNQVRLRLAARGAAAPVNVALRAACEHGHLRVARWLADRYGLDAAAVSPRAAARHFGFALRRACANGHLAAARWLAARFGLDAPAVRACGPLDGDRVPPLLGACANGHLDVAQWLVSAFGVDSDGPERAAALAAACENGHLAVAQWLASGLDEPWARGERYAAFGAACENGHLAVAQWMAAALGATAGGVRDDLVLETCVRGHLAVTRWLAPEFDAAEAKSQVAAALAMICARGDLELAQRVVGEFEVSAADFSAAAEDDGCAVFEACEHGHLAVVQWLAAEGLVPADVHDHEHHLLALACGEHGFLRLAQWLASSFCVTDLAADGDRLLCSLRAALAHDHLDIARWLVATFRPDPGAARRACGDSGLAGRGLETAQWMVAEYGLASAEGERVYTAQAVRKALWHACTHGDLAVAQWLTRVFGLTPADARAHDCGRCALRDACAEGNLRAAQWLAATFGLTAGYAHACGCARPDSALSAACGRNHLGVAQWLTAEFPLAPADAQAWAESARGTSCARRAAFKWVAGAYGLGPEPGPAEPASSGPAADQTG